MSQMQRIEPLVVAVRAHTSDVENASEDNGTGIVNQKTNDWRSLIHSAFIFDTETTIDEHQALNFGCWRFCAITWDYDTTATLSCLEEGIIYADDLPVRNPEGFRLLTQHALLADPQTDPRADPLTSSVGAVVSLLSRREFADLLYKAAYKGRATVVGFNLPFDLSRIAVDWGTARSKHHAGGFSFVSHDYGDEGVRLENRYRPRIVLKTINSKATLISFASSRETEDIDRIPDDATKESADGRYSFRGHFLDLRTLAFAHTDRSLTLETACDKFGVPYTKRDVMHGQITPEYIEYCREDVGATQLLCEKLLSEHSRHPIQLQPTRAYSPASVGKNYLSGMGIAPQQECNPDFPEKIMGYAMSAYYGGRAECRIRRQPVPVVYCDFLSMYPTVCSLLGLWELMTSRVRAVEIDASEANTLLDSLNADELFKAAQWRKLPMLVEVQPDGDILPVRARYGDTQSYNIGLNHYTSAQPQWYALPDVVASKLLTGRIPRVLRAIGLLPGEPLQDLKPVKLRGEIQIDPRTEDFFRCLIEQRKRLDSRSDLSAEDRARLGRFMKVLANSTSYGIYAELNRLPTDKDQNVVVIHGVDTYQCEVSTPERPGPYYFPPIACLIPSAARLMLALLEQQTVRRGGTYAFCDTDSMAIVATRDGGAVPCLGGPNSMQDGKDAIHALSWDEIKEIVRSFEALNPYARFAVPGSILEIEDVNYEPNTRDQRQLYCYAISAKRYALYTFAKARSLVTTVGEPEIIEEGAKQHGLGHLLNPTDADAAHRDWILQLWDYIVRLDALKMTAREPSWLDRAAVSRLTVTSPRLLKPFERGRIKQSHEKYSSSLRAKPGEQVRPYNFLLVGHVGPFDRPCGDDPVRFQLVAPYKLDAMQWKKIKWTNAYSGRSYFVTTTGETSNDAIRVNTYGDVLAHYRVHPEHKSAASDGSPCGKATHGLLIRRHVTPAGPIRHIGKESNKLEDRAAGLLTDPAEALNEYANAANMAEAFRTLVAPVLRELSVAEAAEATGASARTIKRARGGDVSMRPATRRRLVEVASRYARRQLRAAGINPPQADDLAALAAYRSYEQEHRCSLDTPSGRCEGCHAPLEGHQRRWCSDACRKRNRRRGDPRRR